MTIKIYNTLTREKEKFEPENPPKVKFYTCGPTVYDLSHIGHGRTYIAFDVIRRYLEFKGYDVEYAVNITDVEDKVIKRAKKKETEPQQWADEMTKLFIEDLKSLHIKMPDHMPKVSETVDGIIEMVKKLIDDGFAYESDGDVYFDVLQFAEYGKLSGNKQEALEEGARVAPNDKKKSQADFALWKAAKEGEPYWESPWGHGRPGWHIECSAMNKKIFGDTIDIHAGGSDLIFPHHENEITQSEAANDNLFSKYWMHSGMVNIEGDKMAKSEGNFITIREALEKWSPESIRLFLLQTRYRSPVDFSEKSLSDAEDARKKIQECYERSINLMDPDKAGHAQNFVIETIEDHKQEFEKHMDDDFNTPEALATIFNFCKEINRLYDETKLNSGDGHAIRDFFVNIDQIFSILEYPEEIEVPVEIEELVEKREKLRKEDKFEEADKIREEIESHGFVIEDRDEGTKVKKK